MSLHRFAAKADSTEQQIVRSLRDVGIQVWRIKQPCDLLLRFWCKRHRDFCWQPLEVKTPNRANGTHKARLDQQDQTDFLTDTATPVATSFEEAWTKLNQRHQLGAIQ